MDTKTEKVFRETVSAVAFPVFCDLLRPQDEAIADLKRAAGWDEATDWDAPSLPPARNVLREFLRARATAQDCRMRAQRPEGPWTAVQLRHA
jgi:hypothetical protein